MLSSETMAGPWSKFIVFVLLIMALAGGMSMYLVRGGLGAVDESRRFVHPDGFSMVIPAGWTKRISDNAFFIEPQNASGFAPDMQLRRYTEPPPWLDNATERRFQGKPAFHAQFTNDRRFNNVIRFERDGTWFEFRLRDRVVDDSLTGPWHRFLETFRVESATTLPTSMPIIVQ
jgi:hypothetical protein